MKFVKMKKILANTTFNKPVKVGRKKIIKEKLIEVVHRQVAHIQTKMYSSSLRGILPI